MPLEVSRQTFRTIMCEAFFRAQKRKPTRAEWKVIMSIYDDPEFQHALSKLRPPASLEIGLGGKPSFTVVLGDFPDQQAFPA